MSQRWSYGEIFEAIEPVIPDDRPALVHGKRTILWGEFKKRTNNIAQNLLANGIKPGDKIAFYTRNGPEYSEGIAAAFKAGLVHVNVNYRYIEKELIYLIDNSDSSVVVYHQEFRESVNNIKSKLPKVKIWLETAEGNEYTLAVNTLGAFIHSARLQFVEFFGKFISGTGRPFAPLTRSARHITARDE